jgi:hypothetical protein
MELNEFFNRLTRASNPTDYLSRQGFGSRWTRTSGSNLLRDQGYGTQLVAPTYGSIPQPSAPSQGLGSVGSAGIRPNFNRAWGGDMDFPTLGVIANQAMAMGSRAQKRASARAGGYSGRGAGQQQGGQQQGGQGGTVGAGTGRTRMQIPSGVPAGAPSPTRPPISTQSGSRAQRKARQGMLARTQNAMDSNIPGTPGVPDSPFGPRASFSMEQVKRLTTPTEIDGKLIDNVISSDGAYDSVQVVPAGDADARRAQLAQEFRDLVTKVDAEEGDIASRESFSMEQRVGSQLSDGLADTSQPLRRASEPLRRLVPPLRRAVEPLPRASNQTITSAEPLPVSEALPRAARPQWSQDYGTTGEPLPKASQPLRRGVTRTEAPRQTDASRRARASRSSSLEGPLLSPAKREDLQDAVKQLSQTAQELNAKNM